MCGDGVVFAVFAAGAEEEKEEDGDVASVGCRRSGSASSSIEEVPKSWKSESAS